MAIHTLLVFDVEDTWYDDEIGEELPRFFAETLTQYGLRAHFLLIGDRWRRVRDRNEKKFLRAMERHDIGLHSDNALVSPLLPELVANKDWDTGVAIAREYEERGLSVIEEVTQRAASALSRHGHVSGGPFSFEIAREKGLFYHYGYTPNPAGDIGPVRVNGALTSNADGPNYVAIHDSHYRTEEAYQQSIANFSAHLSRLQEERVGFQTCFLGHPYCFMSHNGHIISYHMRNGRILKPVADTLVEVEKLPARRFPLAHLEDVKRRFTQTAALLAQYRDDGVIQDVTMQELRAVYGERPAHLEWRQILAFARQVHAAAGQMPRPDNFTLGEYLVALLDTMLQFSSHGKWPEHWQRQDVRSPRQEPPTASETYCLPAAEFTEAARRFREQWLAQGFLPASVPVWPGRPERLGLGQLMYGASTYCLRAVDESRAPHAVDFPPACGRYPRDLADAVDAQYAHWRYWPPFREDIEPAAISRYARLQLWDTCSATAA